MGRPIQCCSILEVFNISINPTNPREVQEEVGSNYQENVVAAAPLNPHTLEHVPSSTQAPAIPQSFADITVVGQKPHRPLEMSTRQLYPGSAVRTFEGSPS